MKRLLDIDLKLLRTFQAVVDAGGISGAQATLNASQSTLSTQLTELEHRLGFRLCTRGRAGFSLTSEGEKLLSALGDLFAAADQFQNATASIAGDLRGTLKIGVMDAMLANTAWPLHEVLERFAKHAQDTYIDLSMVAPSAMERQLLDGKRDAVIGPFPVKRSGFHYIPLFQERHSLFAAATHPLTRLKSVGFEDLSRHSLIVTVGEFQRFPFIRSSQKSKEKQSAGDVVASATVDQMETHALLIRSGRYVGFLPDFYAWSLSDFQALATTEELQYMSPIYLALRKDADLNLVLRSFVRYAKEQQVVEGPLLQSGAVVPLLS